MLKFVLLALALTVANGQLLGGGGILAGGWKPLDSNGLPDIVEKVARWSLEEINRQLAINGVTGAHRQIVAIKNVESQLVAGTNYRFDMDTIYADFESNVKYTVSLSCQNQKKTWFNEFIF